MSLTKLQSGLQRGLTGGLGGYGGTSGPPPIALVNPTIDGDQLRLPFNQSMNVNVGAGTVRIKINGGSFVDCTYVPPAADVRVTNTGDTRTTNTGDIRIVA